MTFPVAELKFSQIQRTDSATTLLVRLYRVDDGGLSQDGQQIYLRTLKRSRVVSLPPNISKATILAEARDRLTTWAAEEGFNLPPERLICTL